MGRIPKLDHHSEDATLNNYNAQPANEKSFSTSGRRLTRTSGSSESSDMLSCLVARRDASSEETHVPHLPHRIQETLKADHRRHSNGRGDGHADAKQPASDSPVYYERLPHSHCQYPGCMAKRGLTDVSINDAANGSSTYATPWSYNTDSVNVTLCDQHRTEFRVGDFHIIRASDDSLTFMPALPQRRVVAE